MILTRIEAALARLEAVVQRRGTEPTAEMTSAGDPDRERLAASNARLREAIGLSLRQIDGLIARHGADGQR